MQSFIVSALVNHWGIAVSSLALVVLIAIISKYCDFQRRGEAPLIGGWIPYIGAAIELGWKGFPATLNKHSAKLGDVFTLYLFGKRMTFVTNAQMVSALSKLEARGVLNNFPTRYEIIPMIFGDGECRREVVQKYWSSNETTHVWAHFQGGSVEVLTNAFQAELIQRIKATVPCGEWSEGRLMEFIAKLFLPSTTRTFFGNNAFFQSPEYINVLLAFNDNVNALQKGLRPNSIPAFVEAKRKLIKALLSDPDDNPSEAIQVLFQGMEEAGFSDNEKATTLLSILWASNMNAIVSAFWALYHILNDAKAAQAISGEIHNVFRSNPTVDENGMPILSLAQLKDLTITESACLEAMRISSANILRTEAMQDFTFETHKGKFNVRKGDNVVLSTGQIHRDPELFPDPEKFKFDRFANDPVTNAAPVFMKDGQKCNASVLVFSHGKHKCPGRFLAMNELKLLLLYVFTQVEIQILDTNPQLDLSYYGVGSMKPIQDLRIRYRFRNVEA